MNKRLDYTKVNFNASLFYKELERSGVQLSYIGTTEVVNAVYKKHKELLYDVSTSTCSFPAGWIASDKYFTKKILKLAEIPVAPGNIFNMETKKQALRYAQRVGFPVVIKPLTGSHGEYVYPGIDTRQELDEKIERICEEKVGAGYFLLEKHIFGEEYRIFATMHHFIAGVHRTPANITGDGKQSILALIQAENYRRMNPRNNCLCEIKMDEVVFDHLEKQGLTIDHVPKKGQKVTLRLSTNVSKGGNCVGVTDHIHSSVKKLAQKILASIPGLSFCGIDLICQDIRKNIDTQNFVVCEINPVPGLSLHALPEKGKKINVARVIRKIMFPEIKKA